MRAIALLQISVLGTYSPDVPDAGGRQIQEEERPRSRSLSVSNTSDPRSDIRLLTAIKPSIKQWSALLVPCVKVPGGLRHPLNVRRRNLYSVSFLSG